MSSRGPNHDMRGEHVLKVEAELRTNGRTNERMNEWCDENERTNVNELINETEGINTPGHKEVNESLLRIIKAERKMDAFLTTKYSEEEFHSTCPLEWEASTC